MRLTPTELDRLTIFTAAELARRRRARGWKLNPPEALAIICDEMHEAARGLVHLVADDGQRLGRIEFPAASPAAPRQLGRSEDCESVQLGRRQAHGRLLSNVTVAPILGACSADAR